MGSKDAKWRRILHDFYTKKADFVGRVTTLNTAFEKLYPNVAAGDDAENYRKDCLSHARRVLLRFVQLGDVYSRLALELIEGVSKENVSKFKTIIVAVPYKGRFFYPTPNSIKLNSDKDGIEFEQFRITQAADNKPLKFKFPKENAKDAVVVNSNNEAVPRDGDGSSECSLQIVICVPKDNNDAFNFVTVPCELAYALPMNVKLWSAYYARNNKEGARGWGPMMVTDVRLGTLRMTNLLRSSYPTKTLLTVWTGCMQPFYPMSAPTAEATPRVTRMIDSMPSYLRAFVICETRYTSDAESLIVERLGSVRIYDGILAEENIIGRALWGGRKRKEYENALEYCTNKPSVAVLIFHYLLADSLHSVAAKYTVDKYQHVLDAAYTTLAELAATRMDLSSSMIVTKYMVQIHKLVSAEAADVPGDAASINQVYDGLEALQLPVCMRVLPIHRDGGDGADGNVVKKTLVVINAYAANGWHYVCFSLPLLYAQAILKLAAAGPNLETDYYNMPHPAANTSAADATAKVVTQIFIDEILCKGILITPFQEGEEEGGDELKPVNEISTVESKHIATVMKYTNMLSLTHAFIGNVDTLARVAAKSVRAVPGAPPDTPILPPPRRDPLPPRPPEDHTYRRFVNVPQTLHNPQHFTTATVMENLVNARANTRAQDVLKLLYKTYCCQDTATTSSSKFLLLPQPDAKRKHDLFYLVKYDRNTIEVWDSVRSTILTQQAAALMRRALTEPRLLSLLQTEEEEEAPVVPVKRRKLVETSESARQLANKLYNLQYFAALSAVEPDNQRRQRRVRPPPAVADNVRVDVRASAAAIRKAALTCEEIYRKCIVPTLWDAHLSQEEHDANVIALFIKNIHTDRHQWERVIIFQ